jgi:hypothetical protein
MNQSEAQIQRQIKLKFQSEEERNMEAPFLRITAKAQQLVKERSECEQTIAELRKSAPSRDPIERAANQQKITDATLRVAEITTCLQAATQALSDDPEVLVRVLAMGCSTLKGATALPMGLAKCASLPGATPLELGSPRAQEALTKHGTVKGARRLLISRPWGGV